MIKEFRLLSVVLFLVLGQRAIGQTQFSYKDDFQRILAKTKDRDNELFYDKLLERFYLNDPNLTDFEVLSLLIGFTDKPEFKPYQYLETERKIYDINGEGQYKQALDSATTFLKTHPLSVKVLWEKGYSFHKLGLEDSAAHYVFKGRRIFEAMNFSGDGKTPETPIFALGPADGQDFIRKFINSQIGGAKIGMMGSARDKTGNFLDILEVVPKDGSNPYDLYFIIQHATKRMFSPEDKMKMEERKTELRKSVIKNKKDDD
jgi:hypothetical protein